VVDQDILPDGHAFAELVKQRVGVACHVEYTVDGRSEANYLLSLAPMPEVVAGTEEADARQSHLHQCRGTGESFEHQEWPPRGLTGVSYARVIRCHETLRETTTHTGRKRKNQIVSADAMVKGRIYTVVKEPVGANGAGRPLVEQAADLEEGQIYTIVQAATTDFTAAGAPDNEVGTMFAATGAADGDGVVGFTFEATGPGTHNAKVREVVTVAVDPCDLEAGEIYIIAGDGGGTTDFVAVGAGSNTAGTVFVATGAGTGMGTARRAVNSKVFAKILAEREAVDELVVQSGDLPYKWVSYNMPQVSRRQFGFRTESNLNTVVTKYPEGKKPKTGYSGWEWDVGRLFEPSRRGCDHDVHMLVGYKVVREGGGKDAEQRPMLPMRINHSLVAYVPNHDLRRAIVEASRTVTMLE
jgi:hypothetical protein